MEAFTLDTSGVVTLRRDLLSNGVPAEPDEVRWSDLSPFVQGYVEALFADGLKVDPEHVIPGDELERFDSGKWTPCIITERASYAGRSGPGWYAADVAPGTRRGWVCADHLRNRSRGFSDLSPEALALILRDCEAKVRAVVNCGASRAHEDTAENGRRFWKARQRGNFSGHGWEPLTPYLSDDGKVCLREGK